MTDKSVGPSIARASKYRTHDCTIEIDFARRFCTSQAPQEIFKDISSRFAITSFSVILTTVYCIRVFHCLCDECRVVADSVLIFRTSQLSC